MSACTDSPKTCYYATGCNKFGVIPITVITRKIHSKVSENCGKMQQQWKHHLEILNLAYLDRGINSFT